MKVELLPKEMITMNENFYAEGMENVLSVQMGFEGCCFQYS